MRQVVKTLALATIVCFFVCASKDSAFCQAATSDAQETLPPDALLISPDDTRVDQLSDSGFHLYVRKKPHIESILLTETTKDPEMKGTSYAYRAKEWNAINGDEKRILDGAFLAPKHNSLISSTTIDDPVFGKAFHIFIPYVVAWGYSWSRQGETEITNGTFINIRTFTRPYGDYAGTFADNPFTVKVVQVAREKKPEDSYRKDAEKSMEDLAKAGKGELQHAKSDMLPAAIAGFLDRERGKELDLVICVDTTLSMANDIAQVKIDLLRLLREKSVGVKALRLGLVLYRDFGDKYIHRDYGFTSSLDTFNGWIQAITVEGGGDTPEALHEALWAALKFPFTAENRMIILIGDAPAHPVDHGISLGMIEAEASLAKVQINTIILPE